ncbi:MAG: T9SS type A sorting domain-containing protein [Candidatus Krumholzibacteriota bacterium]|nr:T9SS type A sorting domain-containing protein [Candidatus Krumholzibacteriota bacterium]
MTAKVSSLLLLLSLVIAAPSLQAFWCEDGVPVCAAVGIQDCLDTAYGYAGHMLLAWQDYRNLSDADIYVQRIDEIGSAQWTTDGLAICTTSGDQENPQIINDGGGGAIVAWQDNRSGDYNIYAQRIKSGGTIQWSAGGIRICKAIGTQEYPRIVTDTAGGAIVVWIDERSGDDEIYAQRINSEGTPQWTTDGVLVCAASDTKSSMQVIPDGAGGAILTWRNYDGAPSMADICAQRIDDSGSILWTAGGVSICNASFHQNDPQLVTDGAEGAIITWADNRSEVSNIYAQRINPAGTAQWTTNGVLVCPEYFPKYSPQICSDSTGGAVITWSETRHYDTGYDVYAQRINSAGIILWDFDAINVTPVEEGQGYPQIVNDGTGGVIITWVDDREGSSRIYSQKLDGSGIFQWRTGGAPLCLTTSGMECLQITEDGTGGAVAAWVDYRLTMDRNIYAQWVDTGGMPGYRPTIIASISDIPGDEGGWVRLTIEKHSYDDEGWFRYPIYMYNIWRRVDDPVMLSAIDRAAPGHSLEETSLSDWPVVELDGRRFLVSTELLPVQDFPPGTWEVLGCFNAFRQDQYLYVASTPADSTGSSVPMPVFCVSAHTLNPSLWYVSAPDSGYSVDNLAPAPPSGLAGEAAEGPPGVLLEWDQNIESDFSYYIVHRGSYAGFIPSRFSKLGETVAPEFTDEYPLWYDSYYKICSVDRHGNASIYAVLGPGDLTGDDPATTPAVTYLSRNYPNPFNPSTTIKFGLSEAGPVTLKVYDPSGRLVRVVADEPRPAGHYAEQWDGFTTSGQRAASGVYFYKLSAGEFTETKKMVLLK